MAKKFTPNPSGAGSAPAPNLTKHSLGPSKDQSGQPASHPVSIPQKEVERGESFEKLVQEKEEEEKAELAEVSEYLKEAEVKPQVDDDLKALGVVSTDEQIEETFGGKEAVYLPLTEEEIKKGLHHKVIDALRWLAEWSVRVIKWAHRKGIQVILGRQPFISNEPRPLTPERSGGGQA